MKDDIVIRAENLWKRYGLALPPVLRNIWTQLRGLTDDDGPWALRDLSLEVRRGETLGIIGRNGAGKSTLLKVLAGVTPATRGRVSVDGRIFPMIELNAGLHQDLTGRENVYLLGAIMGFSPGELDRLMPEVEGFCELEEWFDRPVRTYSSGMLARLGFAVAVNVDADVLLVDEVLAVGDITFQRKCFERMEHLHNSGKTVVFVSHNIRQVERICDRVLLMEKGSPVAFGNPADVISGYYQAANLRILETSIQDGQKVRVFQERIENAVVEVTNVRFLDERGTAVNQFQTGDAITVEISYHARIPVQRTIIGLSISTIDSMFISGFTSENAGFDITLQENGVVYCRIASIPLLSGIYTLHVKIINCNGSLLGGGTGLGVFTMVVPSKYRLSTDLGLVAMHVEWSQASGEATKNSN